MSLYRYNQKFESRASKTTMPKCKKYIQGLLEKLLKPEPRVPYHGEYQLRVWVKWICFSFKGTKPKANLNEMMISI